MARENYLSIPVSDTVNEMFNEFVRIKEIKKTTAMGDIIEMYMLAKDEALYLQLKKKYLGVENVLDMIADRDSEILQNNFIFIKLGESYTNDGDDLDGQDTMELYIQDEKNNGYSWFSTQSLFNGMNKKKVEFYNKQIKSGVPVRMLFALTKELNGNEIAYSADVLEVQSDKQPICAPDNKYPIEFDGMKARIWIKLRNIKPENTISANMLKISSTGRDLKETISNSQYHFGYVSFKSNNN